MTTSRISHLPRRDGPLPPGARYVGRPSRWGNPYSLAEHNRVDAVAMYANWLDHRLSDDPTFLDPLRDATALACGCPTDQPCHADVIIDRLVSPT